MPTVETQVFNGLPSDVSVILRPNFVKARWGALDGGNKSALVTRCEQYAEWTIPSEFARIGLEDSQELSLDYQSIGAEAVNTMSNSLALTILTPHRPFFKINLLTAELNEVMAEKNLSRPQVDAALSKVEREAMNDLETVGIRPAFVSAAKLLLMTGNALMYVPTVQDDIAATYNLRNYCVTRDNLGREIEICVQVEATLDTLPPAIVQKVREVTDMSYTDTHRIKVFTYMRLLDGTWHVYTAYDGWTDPESLATFEPQVMPWIPLVWNLVRGNHYGRGLVEEYANDFHSVTGLYAAGNTLASILCDIKFIVDIRSGIDLDTMNDSEPGTYVAGQGDGINASTKGIAVPTELLQYYQDKAERRIGRAFLMNTAVIRDAERVTAEEVRYIMEQLETTHGGVYANLSQRFQSRLAAIALKRIEFPWSDANPTIVTGLDSLSRSAENQNLRLWLNDLTVLNNLPEDVRAVHKLENISAKLAAGYGIDYTDYIMTAEEQATAQDARTTATFADELAKSAANNLGGNQ